MHPRVALFEGNASALRASWGCIINIYIVLYLYVSVLVSDIKNMYILEENCAHLIRILHIM